MKEKLEEHFGYLFSEELKEEILKVATLHKYAAGEEIMDYGQNFKFIPLLLSGAVKVLREDDNGNELLLYFLEKGDTCASLLNNGLGKKVSEIRAEAETNVEMLMIPFEKLDEWMVKFPEWRSFVMESYYQRITELLEVIESMAFQQLDTRIYQYLKDKAMVTGDPGIKVTHQEIARDLNSSRVVISRLLKKLENQGTIKIGRNQIDLIEF